MLSKSELTTCFNRKCMMLCEALSNLCKRLGFELWDFTQVSWQQDQVETEVLRVLKSLGTMQEHCTYRMVHPPKAWWTKH